MKADTVRSPAAAGQFYSASPEALKKQIGSFIDKKLSPQEAIACMLPHAGYMYSGAVAAQTLSRVKIREKVILLGPNHTGLGAQFSIMAQGSWKTPFGEVEIDSGLAKKILEDSKYLKQDSQAHAQEHSLEVELPLLQYLKKDFKIVPIAFLSDDLETLKEIGKELGDTLMESGLKDSVLLLASSDMTHYEPAAQAKIKDKEAIQAILELNEDKLMKDIRRLNITMCGYAPVIVMLSAAKILGAKSAELIKYQTSGDVTGEWKSVVGYAGIAIN